MATLWIGIGAALPPAPLPATVPATAFSAARAMADVRTVAIRPHPTGSADIARVRAYLGTRLRALGLRTEERHYLIDPAGYRRLHDWNPQASPAAELVNLIGVLPGRDHARPALVLMAHMDTVWGSPGGGDDSIGLAAILETLRAIRARGVPERDVVVLFTDGEELALSGAHAFWPSDGMVGHVGAVINLEARGAGGRATMFETGDGNGGMMTLFARAVRRPVANSMSVLAYRLMPNSTDFTLVRDRGLPGFNFAIMGRAQYYHSPRATADRLDPRSLQDMGEQLLDLASALAMAPALPAKSADATFFDVAGHGLLAYAQSTGWLVLLGAGAAIAVACAGALRQHRLTIVGAGQGMLAFLGLAAHGLLLLRVLNRISGSGHPNYYDRLAALPQLELQALLACLAALVGWLALYRPPRRVIAIVPGLSLAVLGGVLGAGWALCLAAGAIAILAGWFAPPTGVSRWGGWIGALVVMLVVGIAAQAEVPMAAWIFAWPLLAIGIGAALVAWIEPDFARSWGWPIAGLAAMIACGPLLPLAHLAFLGIGGPIPEAMLGFLLLIAAAFWPLAQVERYRREAWVAAAALAASALVIAVHVRTAPIAPTIPAYSLDK